MNWPLEPQASPAQITKKIGKKKYKAYLMLLARQNSYPALHLNEKMRKECPFEVLITIPTIDTLCFLHIQIITFCGSGGECSHYESLLQLPIME